MATTEQQVGATEQAIEELTAEGREWLDLMGDVARRMMVNHRRQRREQRGRLANGIVDMFSSNNSGHSGRIPFRYRHAVQLGAGELEQEGRLEHRFLDGEGNLVEDPPGRRDYRDKRYRLVPEVAGEPGTPPQDQVETTTHHMEALPPVADHDRPIRRMPGGMM